MNMLGGINSAQREKYWDELSDQEKMERTRQQVRGMRKDMQAMRRMVDMLLSHQHAVSGGVMTPLEHAAQSGLQVRYDMDKESQYF